MVEDIINEMVEKGLIEVKETVDIKAVEKLENIKKKNEEINKCSAYFAVCPALFLILFKLLARKIQRILFKFKVSFEFIAALMVSLCNKKSII